MCRPGNALHEHAEDSILGGQGAYVRAPRDCDPEGPGDHNSARCLEPVQTLRLRPVMMGKALYCLKKSNTLLAGTIGVTIPPCELIGS
jgi:hypothetical protein